MGGWLWALYLLSLPAVLWAFSRLLSNYALLSSYLTSEQPTVFAIASSYLLTPFCELVVYLVGFHVMMRKSPRSPRYCAAAHLMVPAVAVVCSGVRILLSADLLEAGSVSLGSLIADDLIFAGPLAVLSLCYTVYFLTSRRVTAYYGQLDRPIKKDGSLPTFLGASTLGLDEQKKRQRR